MRVDDGTCDREAETHSILLGREKGIEQLRELLWRNALSRIGHGNF